MLESPAVRDLVRLPALLLLLFAPIFLILNGLGVLATWGSLAAEGQAAVRAQVGASLLPRLAATLPASVVLALLLLLFGIYHRPGSRLLSIVLPLGLSFLLLAVLWPPLAALQPGSQVPAPGPAAYLRPGRFLTTETGVVYAEELAGSRASGVVVQRSAGQEERFSFAPRASLRAVPEGLSLQVGSEPVVLRQPVYAFLFRPGRFVGDLQHEAAALNAELGNRYRSSRGSFYSLCFAVVFFVFSCGVLLRLTRWPLFNLFLGLLAVRAFFALFRFLREQASPLVARMISDPGLIAFLPTLILLLAGGVLFLLDLLFVPFDRWEELRG